MCGVKPERIEPDGSTARLIALERELGMKILLSSGVRAVQIYHLVVQPKD
jgi:hypothetical protein